MADFRVESTQILMRNTCVFHAQKSTWSAQKTRGINWHVTDFCMDFMCFSRVENARISCRKIHRVNIPYGCHIAVVCMRSYWCSGRSWPVSKGRQNSTPFIPQSWVRPGIFNMGQSRVNLGSYPIQTAQGPGQPCLPAGHRLMTSSGSSPEAWISVFLRYPGQISQVAAKKKIPKSFLQSRSDF